MQRVYLKYRSSTNVVKGVNAAKKIVPWQCLGTLVLDADLLEVECAGYSRHIYDVVQQIQENGENELPHILVWEDEIWVAAVMESMMVGKSLPEVVQYARAKNLHPIVGVIDSKHDHIDIDKTIDGKMSLAISCANV